jgi:hypothetical protein
MKTEKVVALSGGTVIGAVGYLYADHAADGGYSIGLNVYEELFIVALFALAAAKSNEPLPILLLQIIAAWHVASFFLDSSRIP